MLVRPSHRYIDAESSQKKNWNERKEGKKIYAVCENEENINSFMMSISKMKSLFYGLFPSIFSLRHKSMWCVRRVKKKFMSDLLCDHHKKNEMNLNKLRRYYWKEGGRSEISDDDIDDFEVSWNCHNNLIKAMFRKKML